jgi:hypothetical protein
MLARVQSKFCDIFKCSVFYGRTHIFHYIKCETQPPLVLVSFKSTGMGGRIIYTSFSTGCSKKSFTILRAYRNLFRGIYNVLKCHNVAKYTEFYLDSYG